MNIIQTLGFKLFVSLITLSSGQKKDELFYPHGLRMVLPTIPDQTTDYFRYLTERAPYMSEMTLCAWVKNLNPSPIRYFVSYAAPGEVYQLIIATSEGWVRIYLDDGDYYLRSNHDVKKRNHFCIWFSQTLDSTGFYLNGIIENSEQYYGSPLAIRGGGVWIFGQEQDTLGGGFDPGQSFSGDITDFVIYRRILSREEIYRIAYMCKYPYDTYISPHFAQLEWHGDAYLNYTAPCLKVPPP